MVVKSVDIKHLEAVVVWKLCPKCAVGLVHETGKKVYRCDHASCAAVFDYSPFSDNMIDGLLQKKERYPCKAKKFNLYRKKRLVGARQVSSIRFLSIRHYLSSPL